MLCCCCGYQQLLIIPDCGLAWSGWKTVYADRMHSNVGAAAGTLKTLACAQRHEHVCWHM